MSEQAVSHRATGAFDVKLTPQPGDAGTGLGRMAIEKQFRGDIEGRSQGEMLTAMTAVSGSAAYVAVERVSGTLHGRSGTFALQHTGSMNRGRPSLTITVVPDSGTDELSGLSGRMTIDMSSGNHDYVFDYTIDQPSR